MHILGSEFKQASENGSRGTRTLTDTKDERLGRHWRGPISRGRVVRRGAQVQGTFNGCHVGRCCTRYASLYHYQRSAPQTPPKFISELSWCIIMSREI